MFIREEKGAYVAGCVSENTSVFDGDKICEIQEVRLE